MLTVVVYRIYNYLPCEALLSFWNRGHAYDEKETGLSGGEVCPKSSEVYLSPIWNSFIRMNTHRKLCTSFKQIQSLHQNPIKRTLEDNM
jgi:hypothetical protein